VKPSTHKDVRRRPFTRIAAGSWCRWLMTISGDTYSQEACWREWMRLGWPGRVWRPGP